MVGCWVPCISEVITKNYGTEMVRIVGNMKIEITKRVTGMGS